MKNDQLEDIRILQQESEREGFTLKLNWETLRSRNGVHKNDFLHYDGLKLVGFLGLYDFGNKAEMCGMVHPDYRRQGIFTKLLEEAIRSAVERNYKVILLNSPAQSHSGTEFLKQLPCEFAFSEFQMKWSETELDDYDDAVVRPSRRDDEETEIQLDIQCFRFTEREAKDYYRRILYEDTLKTMMIEKGGRAVGKIRVDHSGGEAWIYGFSILPKYQGKGLGRKALKKVVAEQCQLGYDIFLEVEATNEHALRLYESCGFKTIQRQDYYQYKG
ncbi:GNAT family N-acetyltransferase [Peribacillus frigoritolerans]